MLMDCWLVHGFTLKYQFVDLNIKVSVELLRTCSTGRSTVAVAVVVGADFNDQSNTLMT